MAEIFVSPLEAQPLFPWEDVTDNNAQFLGMMMANKIMVDDGHKVSESTSWAFKVGHPTIEQGSARIWSGAYIDATSHGVSILEAMNFYLAGMYANQSDMFLVNSEAHDILRGASESKLRGHAIDTLQDFKQQMPRTTEVIHEASERFYGRLTEYAILGAALERKIVLDAVDTVTI